MNIIKNKKGFTLIELLAVIVILAILILIAASNIGAVTTRAKKNVLAIEGNTLVDAAKNAYNLGLMDGDIKPGTVCFSMKYLYDHDYYSKGNSATPGQGDGYSGSVLVSVDDKDHFTYKFWISDGDYILVGADTGAKGAEAKNGSVASNTCGGRSDAKCGTDETSGDPAICVDNAGEKVKNEGD